MIYFDFYILILLYQVNYKLITKHYAFKYQWYNKKDRQRKNYKKNRNHIDFIETFVQIFNMIFISF